jgi:hypothetical protein
MRDDRPRGYWNRRHLDECLRIRASGNHPEDWSAFRREIRNELGDDPRKWAELLDEIWCLGRPYSERIYLLADLLRDAMGKLPPVAEE